MAGITLDAAKCVRALSKFSACERCDTVCPTGAIRVAEGLPSVNLSECVGRGVGLVVAKVGMCRHLSN